MGPLSAWVSLEHGDNELPGAKEGLWVDLWPLMTHPADLKWFSSGLSRPLEQLEGTGMCAITGSVHPGCEGMSACLCMGAHTQSARTRHHPESHPSTQRSQPSCPGDSADTTTSQLWCHLSKSTIWSTGFVARANTLRFTLKRELFQWHDYVSLVVWPTKDTSQSDTPPATPSTRAVKVSQGISCKISGLLGSLLWTCRPDLATPSMAPLCRHHLSTKFPHGRTKMCTP